MDAAKEGKSLLETIRPPRLEDAGLEDCALPPEAIKEAFFKAANSIRSLITTDDGNGDSKDCVEDPGPTEGELCDSLIGIDLEPGSPAPCANVKGGGLPQVLGDEVVVGVTGAENDGEEGSDRLLGSEVTEVDFERGKKACVDGLQGLEIDEKDDKFDRDEKEKEEPILVEGYI